MTPATNVIYLVDYKEMLVVLEEENNKMFSFLTFIECYLSLVLYLMKGYIYDQKFAKDNGKNSPQEGFMFYFEF